MIPRGRYPLVAIGFLICLGLGLYPVALILLLLVLTAEAARFWARNALWRIEYTRTLSAPRAFWGEQIELGISVVNRKLLPLPWLEVDDEIPEGLPLEGMYLLGSGRPRRLLLPNILSLGPYERVTRRYRLHCAQRGYHPIGPAILRSGDLFGFGQQSRDEKQIDHLLIYPRILPVEAFGLPPKRPFGDLKARERLFEDPTRLRSVRPYSEGDPLKHIHWKATARTGAVQVKQFDPTAALDILLVLNVATFESAWQGVRPDVFETAISLAASAAQFTLAQDIPTGLLVNATLPGSDQPVKFSPGSGEAQLPRILEALAKLSPFVTVSLEALLQRERRSLPWAATLVIISAIAPEGLLGVLLALRRAGHRVVFIAVGDCEVGYLPGIIVHHVAANAERIAID